MAERTRAGRWPQMPKLPSPSTPQYVGPLAGVLLGLIALVAVMALALSTDEERRAPLGPGITVGQSGR